MRWAAPEILKGNEHSKEADVFSFAMIMIEVRRKWVDLVGPQLTVISDVTGIHRHGPLQRPLEYSDHPVGNRRQTSTETNTPNLHR